MVYNWVKVGMGTGGDGQGRLGDRGLGRWGRDRVEWGSSVPPILPPTHPRVNKLTDRCKNITFRILRNAVGTNMKKL